MQLGNNMKIAKEYIYLYFPPLAEKEVIKILAQDGSERKEVTSALY